MEMVNLRNHKEIENYLNRYKNPKKLIQLHHTYAPSHESEKKFSPQELQMNMKNYHVNQRGFADIAQNFTVFGSGEILTGRPLNKDPAGIYGANRDAICIECCGNFDKEVPTEQQANAIVMLVKQLLKHYNLNPETDVVYHGWYTAKGKKLGTYRNGQSCKTCPGTKFFGGNTRESFEQNLLPLLKGEDTMTQAQFNMMFENMMNEKRMDGLSHWAISAWNSAVKTGLIDGSRPHDFVTREEMMVVFDRWFDRLMGLITDRRKAEVDEWAKPMWDAATQRKVVDGTRPRDYLTREEAIIMLNNWFAPKGD